MGTGSPLWGYTCIRKATPAFMGSGLHPCGFVCNNGGCFVITGVLCNYDDRSASTWAGVHLWGQVCIYKGRCAFIMAGVRVRLLHLNAENLKQVHY